MREIFWRIVATIASQPEVADWLIARAKRTPYDPIESTDGDLYMGRWWLFNPYDRETRQTKLSWCPISVRVHHIVRPDAGRDLHDHPWDARTIILRGAYVEARQSPDPTDQRLGLHDFGLRDTGDTAEIRHDQFHRISDVVPGGAWTLFITGRYRHGWGFWVNGRKVPYREYHA